MSSAVAPMNPMGTHYEKGSPTESYPIQSSTTAPFFPPVKINCHWDPTMIYARTVPQTFVPLPIDFRPYTKVCLEYRTSAVGQLAPEVADDMVFPRGLSSLLRRLDRPLGTCDPMQYDPPENSDMYVSNKLVPKSNKPPSRFVEEIAMPQALLRAGSYQCRSEADQRNWDRSSRLFNNATKQDRYKGPTEPPRQYIWSDGRRCQASGPTT